MIPVIKSLTFIFSIVLLVLSCQENKKGSSAPEDRRDPSEADTTMKVEPQFVESAPLAREWNVRLEMISQNDDRFEVEKEVRENRHVQGRLDTIKTLTYDNTMLRVHTTKNLYAVESAEIEDAGFILQESVEVGMAKNELEEILKTDLTSDYIQVGNKQETFVFSFTFKDNRLEKISFNGYVD